MRHSFAIRWHLAIFAILAVFPFLLVSVFIAGQFTASERARAQRAAQDLVKTVTAAIDAELERYRLALSVLSTSQSLAENDIAAFYARAKKVPTNYQESSLRYEK